MSIISLRQQVAFTLLLFVSLLLLVPQAGHPGDLGFWQQWADFIFEHRLGDVYQMPGNNYNPLYHYILWLYGYLMGSTEKLHHYIHWLKGFTLLFDFAGAFWAASLVPERSRRFGLVLLLLLNIGYLYDSLVWIQVDTIYTFFAFGAVVLAVQQRVVGSVLCFVLAIAAKTQAIIFLPPLVLLWVAQWWRRPWQLVSSLGAGAALGILVLAPFIWWSWENYVPRIIEINLKASQFFPVISLNAFNIWHLLVTEKDPSFTSDLLPFLGLTYHTWGLIWFCSASAVALLPLLVAVIQGLLRPAKAGPTMALAVLSCGSIPLLFAFFNTQMHERYWHATILFLAAYGFLSRHYAPYVLASIAYFLQLESVLHALQLLKYGVLIFHPQFLAAIFALVILLVLFDIYRLAPWRPAPAAISPFPASQSLPTS
jgi:Gpi18-like mannosyltransferase